MMLMRILGRDTMGNNADYGATHKILYLYGPQIYSKAWYTNSASLYLQS